jgi:type IV secretion system protein VirB3
MTGAVMNDLSDPVFKGCTRPAMLWSVPMAMLLPAIGLLLILGMWGLWLYPPAGLTSFSLMVPVYFAMRAVTRRDDQRLRQLVLRLRMVLGQRNRRFWRARTYAPIRFKSRGRS